MPKGQLTGCEIPDVKPGQVWRLGRDLYRILEPPEKTRGPWTGSRDRELMSHRIKVSSLDPAYEEAEGGHYIDESCFSYMERVSELS